MTQLSLVEHALCPLDAEASLRPGLVHSAAYFFTDRRHKPTPDGYQRLETLSEQTDLGAGFGIAMRDLEMRGAGDVLGMRQHGHIALFPRAAYYPPESRQDGASRAWSRRAPFDQENVRRTRLGLRERARGVLRVRLLGWAARGQCLRARPLA